MKNDTESDLLNRFFFLRFQRLMKNIKFYVQIFKNCDERVKENFNSRNKIHLKQNDFSRMTKEIHNKFIFEKIVAMIIMSKNLKNDQSIKRDILIQNIENDDLMFIYYTDNHVTCYYNIFLIFLHDEQSWNNKISLNDFQINKNLFARRKRIASNDLFRHNQSFVNFEIFSQNVPSLKNEQNENVVANDNRYNKRKSTRTIQTKFYKFLLQMRIWMNHSNSTFFSNSLCCLFEFKLTSMLF